MQNTDRDQISFDDLAKEHYSDENSEEYNAFVEKFKPKRTTDDCFTPPNIYEAVRDFVFEEYGLSEGVRVMRPFYPGGDFENEDYSGDCVVIDNPPFSILARIVKFYMEHGTRFFMFAPTLSLFNAAGYIQGVNFVIVGAHIIYENGAKINTSFVTNLGADKIFCSSELYERIKAINCLNAKNKTNEHKIYVYPVNLVNASKLEQISHNGKDLRIKEKDVRFIRTLDAMKNRNKAIFGGGFLISEKAAAEKAAAEKAAAERANAIIWELSEREKEIIRALG